MPQEHEQRQESVWHSIIVPTAVGLEAFFWRVAWFSLVVVCVYFCVFAHHVPARTDHREVEATEPLAHQSSPISGQSPSHTAQHGRGQ